MLGIGDKAAEVPVESYEVECCLGMFIVTCSHMLLLYCKLLLLCKKSIFNVYACACVQT